MDKQEPVAWMYERKPDAWPPASPVITQERWAYHDGARPFWTETPLYTRANRPTDDGLEAVIANLQAQMEAQADNTTPSSVQRDKGLVWLEGWFDLATALRAQSDAEVERDRLREALIEARDQLRLMAKDPEDNYLIKQCNAALGEHRKDGV